MGRLYISRLQQIRRSIDWNCSEPDMRSAEEVTAYLEELRLIIQYLGASDCKLQDLWELMSNPVREIGAAEFGTKIKKWKTWTLLKQSAEQLKVNGKGRLELIEEESVLYRKRDDGMTIKNFMFMRSKEDAQDYRYFPDPDRSHDDFRRMDWKNSKESARTSHRRWNAIVRSLTYRIMI